MTTRITSKDLKTLCNRLNKLMHTPMEYRSENADGKSIINIGNYHIDGAYGGYCLHQTTNESGGARNVLSGGHIKSRELYGQMYAYIKGIEDARFIDSEGN